MKYGIDVAILGELADPRRVVELARAAEESGWDGLFVWDHLAFAWGTPSADPWVTLAAAAQATSRLVLGPAVTPLPRRRPAVVAHTVASLDVLSGGRVVFAAGLGGVEAEFTAFGEPSEARLRAARLDEALAILDALWRGEEVTHHGAHYRVDGVRLAPLPVQRPRVPIWIGGMSAAALRRAAAWDGWIGGADTQDGRMALAPEQVAETVATILRHRSGDGPFDVALIGVSVAGDAAMVRAYGDAGVTWWLEHLHGYRGDHRALLARVTAGPPS
jgi:probable F420-dependent oxidoreductase, Rv2161c family